jgi:hypothetical protein
MANLKPVLFIIGLFALLGCEQHQKIRVNPTYEEPIDPSPDKTANWSAVTKGLHASFVSPNIRFVKSVIPNTNQLDLWNGESWKGERISTQLVLWTNDSITNVSANISNFISDSGDKMPSSVAKARFVKYVITDEFAGGCGYRKPEDFASSLAADALDEVDSYQIEARETRPLWVTIDTPLSAKPGTYKSTITVNIEGQNSKQFELNLEVIDKILPPASDWKFHLDLWQNPFAVARIHNVKPWSEQHWELLKPIMTRLANTGQKVITVSLNKRPWGGQTFDQFEAMIDWRKNTDGTWEYDFSLFDKWVQFMMDLGIKNQISCYSMVPWGNEYYYFDEKKNKKVKIKAAPGTEAYEELWIPFLKQFKVHLKEKSWNNITRMAMDERAPKEMKAMFKLLSKYAPEFGASFADNHKSYKQYPNQLKDLSVGFGATIDEKDLLLRKQHGFISTHYVCCSDDFPNIFTFSPPAEGIFIGWYSIASNFDGFLHWSYNSWVENPLQDSRFRAWPAGDTYMVYPNNRSSIRFESLREGIQDAEKIRILRVEFLAKNMQSELNELNAMVNQFNITEKPENLDDMLIEAKSKLNALAKK